jgi:hypothetical protein
MTSLTDRSTDVSREHNLWSTTVEGAVPMTTVKALLIKAIDDLLAVSKQPNFTACWIAEAGHGKETP